MSQGDDMPNVKKPRGLRSGATLKGGGNNIKGSMTVGEAGRLGGNIVKGKMGPGFYQTIGAIGGRRVRELIAAGRTALAKK